MFEFKIGVTICYILVLSFLLEGAIYCLNQPSDIFLTLGTACVLIIVLGNLYLIRKCAYKWWVAQNNKQKEQ